MFPDFLATVEFSLAVTGPIFVILGLGAWLRRIGLINTMVFTHIPANISLILAALAPSTCARERSTDGHAGRTGKS